MFSDFLSQLRRSHQLGERRLGIGALFGPDAVTPVNFFNCSLISDTISEVSMVRCGAGFGAVLEGSQRGRQSGDLFRQIKSRRQSDNADKKKERG